MKILRVVSEGYGDILPVGDHYYGPYDTEEEALSVKVLIESKFMEMGTCECGWPYTSHVYLAILDIQETPGFLGGEDVTD